MSKKSDIKCRFCELVGGKSDIVRVFEDNSILAFMDKAPVNPGHVLVIPKKHVASFENLDDKLFQKLMSRVREISKSVKHITRCGKVGILIAGFDVPHTHVHVVPMNNIKDVATRRVWEKATKNAIQIELSSIADKLRRTLN